jgi:hypothetical protein
MCCAKLMSGLGRPLRARLASAATVGSGRRVHLVLITGESSAGKTRAAVEVMRAHLARWRLLIPYSATRLELLLDQHLDLHHVVVWLDELQDFLREPRAAAAAPRQPKRSHRLAGHASN